MTSLMTPVDTNEIWPIDAIVEARAWMLARKSELDGEIATQERWSVII